MWLIVAAALALEPSVETMPAWMAGCWEQKTEKGWAEECWTGPRGGLMLGSGRSGAGQTVRDWEVMQIERSDSDDPAIPRLIFYGAPKGQGRTPFQLVSDGKPGVTFVNLEHDYPQRIHYWREGEDLLAEVSLADGRKAHRWRYSRMPLK